MKVSEQIMKRIIALFMMIIMLLSISITGIADSYRDDVEVPEWTEQAVRDFTIDYINNTNMDLLYKYLDIQIQRYTPRYTFERMLVELSFLTGKVIGLGTYSSFEETKKELKTHVLHLCMEKQDLDLYFTHRTKEKDWDIMAIEFVPSEKQTCSEVLEVRGFVESEVLLATNSNTLGATLTLPDNASESNRVPACVLVHDDGPYDRDMTIGNTKLFKDMAESFARTGVATLRYDKRSFIYGEDENTTIGDEVVDDAIEAGKILAEHPYIDTTNIVVLGIGKAGTLAPFMLQKSEGVFTGMIILGAKPDSLLKQDYDKMSNEVNALTSEERTQAEKFMKDLRQLKQEDIAGMKILGKNAEYYYEMKNYNSASMIDELRVPTLIIQGHKDPVVSEDDGWKAFKYELGSSYLIVDFYSFRKLNHLLMNDLSVDSTGKPSYAMNTNLDEHAGYTIANWIKTEEVIREINY